MHEISLVRQIFRTLDEQFSEAELQTIKSIKLKVGLLSNVEPTLLQNAYEAVLATDRQAQADVKLEVELVPIQIECPKCGSHSTINNYKFVCHQCGHPTNNIIAGTELLISGVEMN